MSSPSLTQPQAAYVHVPFCRHRCGYCNFTVLAGRDELVDAYLEALELELRQLKQPRPVQTIFIGGGTPTRLPPQAWQELLRLVSQWFPLASGGEWSVEANPEDVNPEKIDEATRQGVTRWSLGIQSFRPEKRRVLEREHSTSMIDQALEACRQAEVEVAFDLIFGAPGETPADWEIDLDEAVKRAPDHISTYGLTIEKGTRFFGRERRGDLVRVPESDERVMYLAARKRLQSAGWQHYEISNFARPGKRCRHNETYWRCEPYYAAGPGAARYVNGVREVNHRSTTTWIRRLMAGASPVAESETIDRQLAARERLIFGLRRLEGIDVPQFELETGFSLSQLAPDTIDQYIHDGWLTYQDSTLALTEQGILISDALWPDLLVESHSKEG